MIKRKITAILKLGLGLAPAIVGLAGVGAFAGMGISSLTQESKAVKIFSTTEDFKMYQEIKLDELEEKFTNGEIDEDEYERRKDYLNSTEFASSVMKTSFTDNEDVNRLTENVNNLNSSILYPLIPLGCGLLSSFILYNSDRFVELLKVKENMQESFKDENERKRKEEEKQRKRSAKKEKLYSEEIVE